MLVINKKIRILFYFLMIVSMTLSAQEVIYFKNDTINRMDSDNNKTGFWKIYDLKRNIVVSGEVLDNEKFDRVNYFIDGKIFATQEGTDILFYKENSRIRTKLSRNNQQTSILKENGEPIDDLTRNKFFQSAEIPAMYYGGTNALSHYAAENINRSLIGKHGKVVIEVIIDIDGHTQNPKVVSSDNPSLNIEALRLVRNMPRWQPGFQQGHFVRTMVRIPLSLSTE